MSITDAELGAALRRLRMRANKKCRCCLMKKLRGCRSHWKDASCYSGAIISVHRRAACEAVTEARRAKEEEEPATVTLAQAQKRKGLFGKFNITKASGGPCDPEAYYFVLRLDDDPAARRAARTYAEYTCDEVLAKDLLVTVRGYEP